MLAPSRLSPRMSQHEEEAVVVEGFSAAPMIAAVGLIAAVVGLCWVEEAESPSEEAVQMWFHLFVWEEVEEVVAVYLKAVVVVA